MAIGDEHAKGGDRNTLIDSGPLSDRMKVAIDGTLKNRS
jgi:hypothetical protein